MTVDPTRQQDHDIASNRSTGQGISPPDVPPTLFTLPNLAVAEPCPLSGEETTLSGEETTLSGEETTLSGEKVTGGESAPQDLQASEPRPQISSLDFDQTPVLQQPPPLQQSAAQEHGPIEFEPIVDEPAPSDTAPYLKTEQSLLGIWGTRTVVFGLLLVAVVAAIIAARKTSQNPQQPPIAQEADDFVLDDLAISEGVPMMDSQPAVAVSEPVVSAGLEAKKAPVAASVPAPAESTATLSAPIPADDTNDSPYAVPRAPATNAAAVATDDATTGQVDSVPAATASARLETGELPLKPANGSALAEAVDGTATTVAAEMIQPQVDQTAAIAEAASEAVATVDAAAREVARAATTAEPIRYSSTPHAISDLIRFLPAKPNTTPTPSSPNPN